ncbi:MAG: nicotinamide-nucleotide adenylyltransferase [Metallosphaera sp.]|uniref:Nicotinamide-nucleotide adenylyltransferase n=1 Tax=Metallosphaera cuprina (strain Ar-4) TaxID=1006006 RepID=F4G3B7_METCR|nr:nicotinamide-nucleotide adenylyltransferase [Metallosphaera cuprina]AEB94115.1 nicotinamide-nucleotide adenylyltransferase [Metallosphaera cuprina Ar-4]
MIKWGLERLDELIVLIGSAQESHTLSNPFTAGERIEMIRNVMRAEGIPGDRYYLVPIPDILMNNVWAYHVKMYVPSFEAVIARNPLVLRLFKEAGNEILIPPSFNREKYNSTLIRKFMITGEEWESLVPEQVSSFIKSIKGDERLREIVGSDKR